ncbi:MAG TPA: glycosyltransferase [Ramlibacter sp.]|nr:glycosyltransferase [Ramlibacter sp.]
MYQPFRIAHLIDTLSWGGAQKLLVTFAEAARPHGIVPTVISLRPRNDSPFWDELAALGVPVVTLPFRRILEPALLLRLASLLRRERFDVLHTHLTQANVIGSILGPLTGTPVVASIHNTVTRVRRFHALRELTETSLLRLSAQRMIAVGHVVAEAQGRRLGTAKLVTIPNAVSLVPPLPAAERRAVRTALVGDPERPLLISVGRLTAQKGYGDLLAAFAQARERHPQAALVVAGRGDQQAELQARLEGLGLQGQAYLLGARTDVPQLLAASDLYVSASHWEGLPIAVLEAMSAGLPVVATRVGDIPHVVPESAGVVVEPRQPEQLAAAISALLDDPARLRACGAGARAHILKVYSAERWLQQLLELYAQVGRRPKALAALIEQQRG